MSCPRQYYYEFVLDLGSRRTDSAYIQFHRCVYDVLSWLQDEQKQGHRVDEEAAQRYLLALWEIKGPQKHPYDMMYQQQAALLLSRAVRRFSNSAQWSVQTAWEVPLTYGRVRFMPDVLEIIEGGTGPSILIQRLRTGQVSQSERDKEIYALYHSGAEQAYPGATCKVQVVSLATDQVAEVNLSAKTIKTRLARYDGAMEGILQERFPALPNDRECPRCPHYFICPAAEERGM